MTTDEVIAHARALQDRIQAYVTDDPVGDPGDAAKAQVCEFLRSTAGPRSEFFRQAQRAEGYSRYVIRTLTTILQSFIEYLEAGLATGVSPERKAQLDVVSDILGQANQILENERQHPAAAAVLIGASLEEFLRNWVESEGLSIGNSRPGIDAYCKALRAADVITKQDTKDITSWAGIRNHAAHGHWDDVSDRARIRLMLEGVNLFMRKTGAA